MVSVMIRNTVLVLMAALLWLPASSMAQTATADGQTRPTANGSFEAWDAVQREWLSPEAFWLRYAARSGGLTWGRGIDYPPYAKVKEQDTFLIDLPGGPCLMQFFHSRWRRANDVRRWDPAFNEFGSCPNVFD